MNPHPSDDQLRALNRGSADPADAAAIVSHVEACPSCCTRADAVAAEADRFVGRLRRAVSVRELAETRPFAQTQIGPSEFPRVDGYEILSVLGRGGMGVVYKARHVGLNRLVALKMLLAGYAAPADDLVRFRLEAETLARVRHPSIVEVHDIGTCGGLPFFAMEFVDGPSLADRIAAGRLPTREAAALIHAVARAVEAAHARGVIHRDLKPANVLLQRPPADTPRPGAEPPASGSRAPAGPPARHTTWLRNRSPPAAT